MVATPKELYERAMDLDDQERVELVGLLLESLELEDEDGVDAAWLSAIEERIAKLDSGQVRTVPWSEVRTRVFAPRAS